MITVWGRRNSVNVQKVLWALEELDVPYTRENVGGSFGGNRDPDFLAMNPMGLVPVIRDGDVTMFESNAIVRYLSARFRPGVLRPEDHKSLAMAEQWMEWQQQNFAPPVTTLFMNLVRSPPGRANPQAIATAEKNAADAAKVADAWLARHDWFAGSAFSFGDIVMGALFWRYIRNRLRQARHAASCGVARRPRTARRLPQGDHGRAAGREPGRVEQDRAGVGVRELRSP